MARRETVLEARACKWARLKGCVVAKMTECDGVPDRVFFVPGGRPIVIEFKRKGEVPEGLQHWYLDKLRELGYYARWCDTWEGFLEIVNGFSSKVSSTKNGRKQTDGKGLDTVAIPRARSKGLA